MLTWSLGNKLYSEKFNEEVHGCGTQDVTFPLEAVCSGPPTNVTFMGTDVA